MDGVDVALLETDGETRRRFGPSGYCMSTASRKRVLRGAIEAARDAERPRRSGRASSREAEGMVTTLHAEAVRGVPRRQRHRPPRASTWSAFTARPCCTGPSDRLTVQIGDGPALARETRHSGGLRFPRRRCRGGRAGRAAGAGLITARWRGCSSGRIRSRVLNLGGVANVTFIDGRPDPIACDTGPAMR